MEMILFSKLLKMFLRTRIESLGEILFISKVFIIALRAAGVLPSYKLIGFNPVTEPPSHFMPDKT